MKLTNQQIDQLYTFTRQHFVEWYDLQTELVDHLADDIENIWEKEPNITFNQAKLKAFKKFGIFGFQDVIAEKQKALNKKYWKLVWSIFKDYFKIPKILLTGLLILIVFSVFDLLPANYKTYFAYSFLIGGLLFIMVVSFRGQLKIKRKQKESGKKWMFEQIISNFGGMFLILQLPIQFALRIHYVNWNTTKEILFSIILVISSLFFYVIIYIIPSRLEDIMQEEYPEYKLYKKA